MAPPSDLIDQVASFHDDAFSWAATCCGGDLEEAADILQECYVKIVAGRATFAGGSSLKTWWLAVVRFTALEQRRGRLRWQKVAEAFRDWMEDFGGGVSHHAPSDALSDITADQLAAALAGLPRRQAEVLHLVFQHDLSLSDAAVVMSVSVGSTRQHYDRAKKRLRRELAGGSVAPLPNHAP